MIYLSGSTNDTVEKALVAAGVGLMAQPATYGRRTPRYPFWGADSGCFNPVTYVGDDRYLRWLETLDAKERCLFATCPDVARTLDGDLGGDPVATWARFEELGGHIREMGYPVALVAQDGIEAMDNLAEQVESCDALFLGGSTAWKLSLAAESVCRVARNAGKWVHMGRCNSLLRFERARAMGCQSVDGNFVGYGPDANAPKVDGWCLWLRTHPMLPAFHAFEAPEHPVHRAAWLATDTAPKP